MAFVEETHVEGRRHVYFRFLVDNVFDTFEVAFVVVLLVEVGVQAGVRRTVVVEGFRH